MNGSPNYLRLRWSQANRWTTLCEETRDFAIDVLHEPQILSSRTGARIEVLVDPSLLQLFPGEPLPGAVSDLFAWLVDSGLDGSLQQPVRGPFFPAHRLAAVPIARRSVRRGNMKI